MLHQFGDYSHQPQRIHHGHGAAHGRVILTSGFHHPYCVTYPPHNVSLQTPHMRLYILARPVYQKPNYSHLPQRTHSGHGSAHGTAVLTSGYRYPLYAPYPPQETNLQPSHKDSYKLQTHHEYSSAHGPSVLTVTQILINQRRQQKLKLEKERLEKETLLIERQRELQHQNHVDLKQQNNLNLSEAVFVQKLSRYIMEANLQRLHGYPTESAKAKGAIEIYKHIDYLGARPNKLYKSGLNSEEIMEKQCIRCERTFHLTKSGGYINAETCTFHWGKLYDTQKEHNLKKYTCCSGGKYSAGCTHNAFHVWTGIEMGINGPYHDFVYTRSQQNSNETKVYALDCEMVFTGRGLEVARVTLVDCNNQLIYDHYVQPMGAIVDYNTRFSGITKRNLSQKENSHLKTFTEVQRDLLQLINADTILIGHGLENDLRVLRMVHKRVVDTSYEFPHPLGFPYRCALKSLSKKYLKWDIRSGDMGHSSVEDSIACMELMKWKVHEFVKSEHSGRV
ncbi:putative exonuclease GOR [Ceratitis capitata]|uniref:putative exonuclease GOR n=1 Tax=Ceratitis capitata TaxID=7213 RepID=UPI0003298E86|nr:putative exonuclease GOR [Ceratitis capitata]